VYTNKDSASFNNHRFKLLFIPKTTSINPFKFAKEWEVFPNPVINQIKLLNGQLLAKNSIIIYEIYNDLGVLLRADQIEFSFGEMEEINVAAFPKGIYFIKIQHEFHNQTIRFIK
ncbi:MAG: Secretion system C-terminal sorting domain, partial [Bacteroidota bacterium]